MLAQDNEGGWLPLAKILDCEDLDSFIQEKVRETTEDTESLAWSTKAWMRVSRRHSDSIFSTETPLSLWRLRQIYCKIVSKRAPFRDKYLHQFFFFPLWEIRTGADEPASNFSLVVFHLTERCLNIPSGYPHKRLPLSLCPFLFLIMQRVNWYRADGIRINFTKIFHVLGVGAKNVTHNIVKQVRKLIKRLHCKTNSEC